MSKERKLEQKFLNEVKNRVDNLIDKICDEYGFDRAFFEFKLSCSIMNEDFDKYDEVELINDEKPGYCEFCRQKTFFYENGYYYCPECYKKLINKAD